MNKSNDISLDLFISIIRKLYDFPNGKNVVSFIRTTEYGLRINDICGSWVQIIYKGKMGWVKDEWLCGNPWTSCS